MAKFEPSITVEQARAIIKAEDRETVIDCAKRFANCTEADVSDEGGVWIANPMVGHWLDDDKLCLLAEGMEGNAL